MAVAGRRETEERVSPDLLTRDSPWVIHRNEGVYRAQLRELRRRMKNDRGVPNQPSPGEKQHPKMHGYQPKTWVTNNTRTLAPLKKKKRIHKTSKTGRDEKGKYDMCVGGKSCAKAPITITIIT